MTQGRSYAEFPVSDSELLRRAMTKGEPFSQLWEDEYPGQRAKKRDKVYGLCVYLAREQRGYGPRRNPSQIKRVAKQSKLVSTDIETQLDEIIDDAIEYIDDYTYRDQIPEVELQKLLRLPLAERRQAARLLGLRWPTQDDIQEKNKNVVFDVMKTGRHCLVSSPTASGKTRVAVTTPWSRLENITGGEPVILLVETHDARDEVTTWAKENGLSYEKLLGYKEACPVAGGSDDDNIRIEGLVASKWFKMMIEEKGRKASTVHDEANKLLDGGLPCCVEGGCTLKTQWDNTPRDEDDNPTADLVVATHSFAHVPSISDETNIILDEQPTYEKEFDQARIKEMVNSYLSLVESPIETWEEFVQCARGEPDEDYTEEIGLALRNQPPEGWIYADSVHILTPYFIRALWRALNKEPDRNGRSTATVEYTPEPLYQSDESITIQKRCTVVVDADNNVRAVRDVPDFSNCRSVVGLDAWPSFHLWKRNVDLDIDIECTLTDSEHRYWKLFERGLVVIQVGENTHPDTKGTRFKPSDAQIIIEHLQDMYQNDFRTAGTPKSIESRFKQVMEEAGINNPEVMTLGKQNSLNKFGEETVGLLYECIDPGDDYILNLLNECGLSAEPEYHGYNIQCDKCKSIDGDGACPQCVCDLCSGSGCSRCNRTGHKRAHGRGFVGPDAGDARKLLATVRESNNTQMIGRWGRRKIGKGSVVYSYTNAVPNDYVDIVVPGIVWRYTDKQAAVVEQLREQKKATVRKITEGIESAESGISQEIDSISRQAVRQTLCDRSPSLLEHRKVAKHEKAGANGADIFEWVDEGPSSLAGIAELGPRFS